MPDFPRRLASLPVRSTVLVQGASRGIGLGLVKALLQDDAEFSVIATCRDPGSAESLTALDCDRLSILPLDVTEPCRIEALAGDLKARGVRLSLVINAAGVLHGEGFGPEKKLEDLDLAALEKVFAVNTFGPALLLRALRPLMGREGKTVFAVISARVGSISDNRLGGWYAYRASKAALNQIVRTAGIEFARRNKNAIVAALHPGTTDTGLSAPFQANVPTEKLFSVEQTCEYLLRVIDGLSAEDSGGFFAWDGKLIDW
ncbi:MAG TPA: SDR family NAD(P)-dependent oxidoreductase [Wenzhouxiangellaceae bacterium]|nr:SDR family NAD(P)-dependent oxidoreductase [Wenzhouxiangellaceae bacterium]